MEHAQHHIHSRKRSSKSKKSSNKFHEYPSKNKCVRLLDGIVMLVAFVMPLMSLPQVYKIWILHQVAGVSILTWSAYCILAIPMLIYGIVHKATPLIIMNSIWILMEALIVIGTIVVG